MHGDLILKVAEWIFRLTLFQGLCQEIPVLQLDLMKKIHFPAYMP